MESVEPVAAVRLLSDAEFYKQLDHCMQCQQLCQEEELRAYLGVCGMCHYEDILEVISDDEATEAAIMGG